MAKKLFYLWLTSASLLGSEVDLGTLEIIESTESSSSLSTQTLSKDASGETLGEYLKNRQFVNSATFGPAVGRPVIKGLDGYRVGITNGSIANNDLSAMSHDHAVAMMPKVVERIELIKGPSSLLYGNNSAGVIQTKGEEHIDKLLEKGFGAELDASSGTNGTGSLYGGKLRYRAGDYALYLVQFTNDAEQYKDGDGNSIKDSDIYSHQTHLVLASKLGENHMIKAYYDTLNKEYGIPNVTDRRTWIDMDQTRYGAVVHSKNFLGSSSMESEIQQSDYLHTEYEGSSADGLFGQKLFSISNKAKFESGTSDIETTLQYNSSSYQVCHEHGRCTEFTTAERTIIPDGVSLQQNIDRFNLPFAHGHPMPNIDEQTIKVGAMAKQLLDDTYALDISVRGELRDMQIDNSNIQEEWLVTDAMDEGYYDNRDECALSASIGLYSYYDLLSVESSLSYIERLPAASELYWNGFHHATNSYIMGDRKLDNERSTNFDISFLYEGGASLSKLSGYYYDFDNYLFQTPLADIRDPFHGTEVWQMMGQKAALWGVGFNQSYDQYIGQAQLTHKFNYETIRGKLDNGNNIPRLTPDTLTLSSETLYKKYTGKVEYKYVDKSRRPAPNETNTPSYYTLNVQGEYKTKSSFGGYSFYIKGFNLTNEQIYNHISFLKTTAPMAGRQIRFGIRANL